MASILERLMSLPAFLVATFVFWWSPAFMTFTYSVKIFQWRGPRTDMYNWGRFMVRFFGAKVVRLGSNLLYDGPGPILYLANHRSWADFFIDIYITQGTAAFMSRWLVYWVFPVFMSVVIFLKGILLFKRGAIADKEKFNAWLDAKLKASHAPGVVVYPEGHRSTRPKSLPLKRGMIHYAHSRKMPVQIMLSKGKEAVMSEKRMQASRGVTVVTSFSEVIQPEGLAFEEFASQIQKSWDAKWEEVFSVTEQQAQGLPLLNQGPVPGHDYSFSTRLSVCAVMLAATRLFCLVISLAGQLGLWLAVQAGPTISHGVVTVLAGWLGLSLARSCLQLQS